MQGSNDRARLIWSATDPQRKKLEEVQAGQALSRVNRTALGKTDTFVLDVVNSAEDITATFAPFYERTWAQPTDPNILSNLKTRLWQADVLDGDEVDTLVELQHDQIFR